MNLLKIKNSIQIEKVASILVMLLVLPVLMFAQTGVESTLTQIKDWVTAAANVAFIVILIVGIIRTVTAFVSGSPNAPRYLLFLIIAAAIWFGFTTVVQDLEQFFPGIENL